MEGKARTREADGGEHGDGDGPPPGHDGKDGGSKDGGEPGEAKVDGKGDGKGDDAKGKEGGRPKPLPRWPFVVAGLVLTVFVGVVLTIIFKPRPNVWTNDAYVSVHYATIAPRVSGQVASVPVDDNQPVRAGQVLATLDPRDYQTAVDSAEAALARDTAQVGGMTANVARQPAVIDEQQANVASAEARLAFSEADARRFTNLAATGAGTVQQRQQADTSLRQARAQLDSAIASLRAAQRQLDALKAQQAMSEAVVNADKAQLAQSRLNLSYTRILAPIDGTVGERSVQVGNTVAAGATLMTVVPLSQVYIISNYRELDLLHVRRGQAVTIHIDAYRIDLRGHVDSIAPASGTSFAPIQPNNATGNFTKIVQRLPVKITVAPDEPLGRLLRVGLSVETTIHTGLEDVVGEQRAPVARVTRR